MECHLPLGRMRSSKVALNVPAGSMAPVSASLLAPFLMTPRTLLTVLIMAPSNLATSRWELNIPWNHTGNHSSVWTTYRWEFNMPWNHAERCPSKSATICQKMNTPWNHTDRHPSKSARIWTHPEIIQRDTLQNQPGYEHTLKSYRETPFKISQDMNTPWNHKERRLSNQPGDEHALKLYRDALQNQPPSWCQEMNMPWNCTERHPSKSATASQMNMPWDHTGRHPSKSTTINQEMNMPWNHEGGCPSKSTTFSQEMNTAWSQTDIQT